MLPSKRQQKILELLNEREHITVEELVEVCAVTPQTIRTDLRELHHAKKLIKFHGGAKVFGGNENVEYEARRRIAAPQKTLIGKFAANMIPDGASLFINIGTTTEAFCDALVDRSGLMVITNNINVASSLRHSQKSEVIIAGGVVRPSDGGIVGEAAVDFIRNFKVDYAIIGSSAIDSDGALLDFDFREVKVAQAIIENARHVILVADSTKFDKNAPVRIAHISQVDTFVTDKIDDTGFRKICHEAETTLIEVELS